MKFKKVFFAGLLIAAFLLQACGASEAAVATSVAATLQISQLETAAAGGGGQTSGNGADNGDGTGGGSTATATATGTITPSPTSGIPLVSVSQDTNCRRGPRIDYDYVTTIEVGQQVEVLKTFPGANYVVVKNPNGSGDCWLWLQYANQTDFGSYELAVATQPATPTPSSTPTPIYTWSGTWNLWNGDLGAPYVLTMTQAGNSVTGSYAACTISGTLSADWRTLTGSWNCGGTGTFLFYMLDNLNQVVGNWDTVNEYCAARNGAGKPAPCLYP